MAKYLAPTKGGFPDENVSSLVKQTKEWLLQYCRAVMGTTDSMQNGTLGYRSREKYRTIREYAMGKQPLAQYIEKLAPKTDVDENGVNKLVISDKIIQLIPKLRAIAISLVEKANDGYDLTINPIDPQAALEMEEEARDLKARVVLRQSLAKSGMPEIANSPAIAQQPGEPEDLQGVEVHVLGMRHKVAMKSELIIKQVLNNNKYQEMRQPLAADLVDFGAAVLKDSTVGCNVTIRKVDLRGFVCSPFIEPDASDIFYAGEIRRMPLNQLIAESNGTISKAELEELYKLSKSGGNQGIFTGIETDFNVDYYRGRVQVLDLEILSTDIDAREERTTKYGNKVFGRTKPSAADTDNKKIYKKYEQTVYTCKWVVNTDILYDFGKQINTKIDVHNPSCARLSYHVVTGHCHDMMPYSRTEAMMYYADRVQMSSMKMEHIFNTAVQKGYALDLSTVEDIAMGAGGENMTAAQILELFFSRGILVYRSQSLTGDNSNYKPITDLPSGLSAELELYWKDIQSNIQQAKETIGLNEVTDGNAPNPDRLNAGTEAAINGTKNAMSDMFNADRKLLVRIAEGAMIRAQNLFKLGKGEEFINSLGTETVQFIKGLPTIEPYRFGFQIQDRPTPEDMQQFELAMQKALQENQIDIADMMTIRNMRNLKQQTAYLVYACRKNREMQQQMASQQAEQNAQLQAQAAEQAEAAKQKTLQVEYQLKGAYIQQERDLDLRNGTAIETIRLDGKRIDALGRVDASRLQATGRDQANIRDNQTKLAESEKPGAADQVDLTPADLTPGIIPQSSPEHPIVPGVEELAKQKFSFLAPPVGGSQQQQMPASDPMSGMPADSAMEEESELPADGDMEAQEEMGEGGMPGQQMAMADEGPSDEDIMRALQGG